MVARDRQTGVNGKPVQLGLARGGNPAKVRVIIGCADVAVPTRAQNAQQAYAICRRAAFDKIADDGLEITQRRVARGFRAVEAAAQNTRCFAPVIVTLVHRKARDPEQTRHQDQFIISSRDLRKRRPGGLSMGLEQIERIAFRFWPLRPGARPCAAQVERTAAFFEIIQSARRSSPNCQHRPSLEWI
jgi:hypothetical protein